MRLIVATALLALASPTLANTWLEPFDSDVVSTADTFVVGTLDARHANRLKVERVLAGDDPGKRVDVVGFDDEAGLEPGSRVYAWLERDDDGKWRVRTPTSSIDSFYGEDGRFVVGSFRTSCAGGLYTPEFYERVHTAWFALLHGDRSAQPSLEAMIREELAREPEFFGGEGDPADAVGFFRQTAALEVLASDATLGPAVDLERFLVAKDWHAQVSAVRALASRDDSTNRLIDVLADARTSEVPAMVAARLLRGREVDTAQRKRLEKLAQDASQEEVWLCGGSIMDPRIVEGYSSVSPREAIEDLLKPGE